MTPGDSESFDVVIVGAGFAGLYALYRMQRLGLSAIVLEAGSGIGGTWFWNAYPGARCDVESFEYSYSFDDTLQQEWRWPERYSSQQEIVRYLEHVVERFALGDRIRLGTRVDSARWQNADDSWQVGTSNGEIRGRFLLMATGCLSKPNMPKIDGIDSFEGELFHTGRWPHRPVDLAGRRVGVIGTGSSGVQVISQIAPDVESLHVFQRTPHWIVPAGNRRIDAAEDHRVKSRYGEFRHELATSLLGMGVASEGGTAKDASQEEREQRYERAWQKGGPAFLMCFDDLLFDPDSNATACEFLARKIRAIVNDAEVAAALIPDSRSYPVGARRLVMDDSYYSRFNLPHVHLVDTRQDAIAAITPQGVRQDSGRETALDLIVLATGFDALTGAMLDIDIRGQDGLRLREKWSGGPKSYLGFAVAGFPNLFTITGPGSPSVFSNVVVSIEQHIDFAAQLIEWMREKHYRYANALGNAEQEWGSHLLDVARPTVLAKVDSWYWGANVEGKPRSFLPYLGGVGTYREKCNDIAARGFEGFGFG